jgi:serine protease inhibitor
MSTNSTITNSTKTMATTPLSSFVNRFNDFMLNNLKDESHVTSPLSIFVLLSLAHKGSKENTFKELGKIVFGSETNTESDVDTLLDDLKVLMNKFNNINLNEYNNIDLSMLNNFYTSQLEGYEIEESYTKLMSNFGDIKSVDFAKSETVSEINNKVEQNTKGLIKSILSDNDIDKDTLMVLLNCLYFKAKWINQFKHESTSKNSFTLLNGSTKELDTMYLTKKNYYFYEDSNYKMLSMPYQGNLFSFDVILPKVSTTSSLNVDSSTLLKMLYNSTSEEVNVSIPKFEHEFELDVKQHLQKLGFNNMFTLNQADFSGIINEPLYVGLIKHKAVVKVNENGTEASAVTAMSFQLKNFCPQISEPKTFNADHSFRYFIRFIPENMIMFSGQFNG